MVDIGSINSDFDRSAPPAVNGSVSTLGTVAEGLNQGASKAQITALEEMQMRGILVSHQFVSKTVGNRLLNSMVELVSRVIE